MNRSKYIGDVAYASFGLIATILSTLKNLAEKQKLVKIQPQTDNISNHTRDRNRGSC